MIRKLIGWSLDSPVVVILFFLAVAGVGVYSFANVNVEAYPDPAPAIIELIAQYPGASAEEVERQVTIPLEVTMAGMPKLKYLRSKSLFGLSHLRLQFEYGYAYEKARQEVINRLQFTQQLPPGVTPQLSPESPTGEIFRYTLRSPKDASGRDIYTLNDLKSLQDWVLEREFRRVPRIVDVTSRGGTVKRYEIHLDPDAMKRLGITLQQVQTALSSANVNAGGDYVIQGEVAMNVRSVGLLGGGRDPVEKVLSMDDPVAAAAVLRAEEANRVREIRQLVITSVNNREILLEDVVVGGRLRPGEVAGERGVVVGHQTRLGRSGLTKPDRAYAVQVDRTVDGPSGKLVDRDEDDKVECIVLLRKGEETLPALADVRRKVEELNDPASGRILPGVRIEPYYDRTDLIGVTTDTVHENLVAGTALVSVILLMFLSNVRSAVIVAVNIPLALLFAFAVLYGRGLSANLLSIGAIDFGIIVDSSVIIVENIYRKLSAGEHADLPLKERILLACLEIERPLLFSTLIIICAFVPLFTMSGPEGQIFGPMADTYAFALGGALLLAVLLAPALCLLFFKRLEPARDNALVRFLKQGYLRNLARCLDNRWLTVAVFAAIIGATFSYALPRLGREFMPELEEGNLWIRGTFPLNESLEGVARDARAAREIMARFPEVDTVVGEVGRPDDGTDPCGFYNAEFFVPLRPDKDWPAVREQTGWRAWLFGPTRPRTKAELITEMNEELSGKILGVDWGFSQNIRDNVMEALSGVKGDNSVKVFGPDLGKLEELAGRVRQRLRSVPGLENVGIFNIKGQTNLEFRVDLDKCKKWGVSAADVNNVVQSALGGKAFSTMIEGERLFDITTRLPRERRGNVGSILDTPVDVTNNQVIRGSGPAAVPAAVGSGQSAPSTLGSQFDTTNPITNTPRLRLRDLVSPVGAGGAPDASGRFERPGASTIYREQGRRMIAIKFSVRGRDLAGAVAEAREKTQDLFHAPYRAVWSGEFQEMEEAEARLMIIVPASLILIFLLLYFALGSVIDSCLVLVNVVALSIGGIWALYLTGTNFSISAAVGFISIFGVAVMDGLLLVTSFSGMRSQGVPLREAILRGAERRVRPVMMTALTAIFGLLPAAFSTRIGAQTQQPLAIVVVGGMATTLLLTRYLTPVLYSFFGYRQPPVHASSLAH